MATIEDFKNLGLKVAKIIEAQKIENSDKLLKLIVDLGTEKRQIIAGIGKDYEPKELLGRQIIIASSLEPRRIMGFESQGMLLATRDQDGKVVLIQPEKESPNGSDVS